MGKRIIARHRGRGTSTYRAPSHNFVGKLSYRNYDDKEQNSSVSGIIIDLLHCSGHSAPLAKVKFETGEVIVQFPSKKTKEFNASCRATIGVVSGAGRLEKPFGKAGKKFYAMKARNRLYPITSGVSMNAVDHPFGSGRGKHIGKPKTVSRNAPPGRKV